jgi:polyhydroxyalkanoate synthase
MATTSTITTEEFSPSEIAERMRRDFERNMLRMRNGIKVAAGVDRPGLGLTPKDTVWTLEKLELWRYRSKQRRFKPPVLMVMSLVSRSYIFDLRPGNSLVEYMLDRGFDVYVLDWGVPDHLEANNTLSTYTDEYLPAVVEAVCDISNVDSVTMNGYCFGGVLALLYAAGHPGPQLRNLITMATPFDQRKLPMQNFAVEGRAAEPEELLDENGNVPAEVMENYFKMLKPTAEISGYMKLWDNLWNDEFVESYQAMTGWGQDQIPFPGAAYIEMVKVLGRTNAIASGVIPLGGRELRLSDITCPFLSVLGEKDHIVPIDAGQGVLDKIGSTDKQELAVRSGHVGLFVGKTAHKGTLPPMCDWIEAHSDPA